MLKSINFEIIDICNLRCSMCDIWKNTQKNTISISDFEKILKSKHITNDTNITLTWWEPLLHPEIKEIFLLFNNNWLKIHTLSTNWVMYEKLEELLMFCIVKDIQIPNIHISIDWMEDVHDIQRWVKWSFKKSINTIMMLKKSYKNINIKIKYTITKNNIEDIKKVYLLSQKLWVDIDFKAVEYDDFYTNKIQKPQLLDKADKEIVINILRTIYRNNLYANNLIHYLEFGKLRFKCTTPNYNLFIMANWETYCCTKYESIWNIKDNSLDEIYYNLKHKNIIATVDNINCSKCYSLHWAYKSII